MPQVSTTLAPEMVRELDHLAAQQQVTCAELIRALILEALDGRELAEGFKEGGEPMRVGRRATR
jgi:hypothetical protein